MENREKILKMRHLAFFVANLFCLLVSGRCTSPHIVLIYADDLGWNDVSSHGSPEIPTPNIDALAMGGIVLQNYYGQTVCTPSRGSLLTGKYPFRLGLQGEPLNVGPVQGLPLNETTLPQHLKELGYRTHMVGKWHLGYKTKEYTPAHRGFDTFFGYYNGWINYYDYTTENFDTGDQSTFHGVDLQNGTEPVPHLRGKYATHAFTDAATDIINNHDVSKPLFLYVAHAAAHEGNGHDDIDQAPQELVERFMYIGDLGRRIYAAKVAGLDDSVGAIFKTLSDRGMLENSIFLFASDNGGQAMLGGHGSNHPLRGGKGSVWEGAYRVPAALWSPLLAHGQPRVFSDVVHVTDWMPTLYTAAGGDVSDLGTIDGMSVWEAFLNGTPSPRKSFLYNVNQEEGWSAIRSNDLKLVNGTNKYGPYGNGPSGFEYKSKPESMSEWVFRNGSVVRDVLREMGVWDPPDQDAWYESLVVSCESTGEATVMCDEKPCLFNLTSDPCEQINLADQQPDVVSRLMSEAESFANEAVAVAPKKSDPNADPVCHNFLHVPWMEPEWFVECDYASGTRPPISS